MTTRKSNSQIYFKICPKCASIDVMTDFTNPVVWNYGSPTKCRCNSCGHISYIFPEVPESEIPTFRDELKKRLKETQSTTISEEKIDAKSGYYIVILYMVGFLIAILAILILSWVFKVV